MQSTLLRLAAPAVAFALLAAAPGPALAAEQAVMILPDATAPVPAGEPAEKGRTLVPLHSTVIAGGGRTRLNFSGLLSIHNASETGVLVVEAITYRDQAGRLIERTLDKPVGLKPYASMQVLIAQEDVRGGIGASFVIDWSSPQAGDEPLVEAVMVAVQGTQGYSFISTGRRVTRP
ncbi:DUF3124 domain-containing protein [Rhodoplanes roseus]|uniref:DUF3124 domain-containing protein n=1 Tax=Rhodoplanes roseus TaxID=29409 RepID=A0A327KDV5_9BRAD|nr:DUF3124 domain-containing protein [Rhodoplanes roseus]RAI36969.1 hypothetical protein CH341_29995 [Rhodoplanes roseus]